MSAPRMIPDPTTAGPVQLALGNDAGAYRRPDGTHQLSLADVTPAPTTTTTNKETRTMTNTAPRAYQPGTFGNYCAPEYAPLACTVRAADRYATTGYVLAALRREHDYVTTYGNGAADGSPVRRAFTVAQLMIQDTLTRWLTFETGSAAMTAADYHTRLAEHAAGTITTDTPTGPLALAVDHDLRPTFAMLADRAATIVATADTLDAAR